MLFAILDYVMCKRVVVALDWISVGESANLSLEKKTVLSKSIFCFLFFSGYIFDLTGHYDWSFHVGGAMFIIAGSLYCLLHLPVFAKKRQKAAAKVSVLLFN